MSRIAYVNGRYVPHRQAAVHIEDRGYQFSDGVYEVIATVRGRLIDEEAHLQRLDRSLSALRMRWPMTPAALRLVVRELIRRNRLSGLGAIYLQITRGVAPRNHPFPGGVEPALVMTARPLPPFDVEAARLGVRVIALPDERWKRPDIKSVSLLANVLAKQQAVEAGAYEAWLVDDKSLITEGTASNAWIVTRDGELVTRQADRAILNGITRCALIDLAGAHGVRLVERAFEVAEARNAAEAFLTSTTSWLKAVVRIDDAVIGDGRIGPLSERLLSSYVDRVAAIGAASPEDVP